MKYIYRMYYEPEEIKPPDGYYVIRRKRCGILGWLDSFWEFFSLGRTQEDAIEEMRKKLNNVKEPKILIKEWKDE